MRKVFISTALLSKFQDCTYYSDEYDIAGYDCKFPISFMMAKHVEEGDEVLVVTAVNQEMNAQESYALFKEEIESLCKAMKVVPKFVTLSSAHSNYKQETMNRFFKETVGLIQEGDRIYFDMTYGIKPNTFVLMIALNYMEKALRDVYVEEVIYAERFRGQSMDTPQITLFDLTSLIHLNAVVGKMTPASKKSVDSLLHFMLDDE